MTGFEPGEALGSPADAHDKITYQNLGDPDAGALAIPSPTFTSIYYEDGTSADRYARLIEDPTMPGNHVLHYWLQNAAIPAGYLDHTKGRIQTNVRFGEEGQVQRLYIKQRVYFHPDLALLESYPPAGDAWWLGVIIQTLWFGAEWEGHVNPARITILVGRDPATGTLTLAASLNHDSETFWTAVDPSFVLPTGRWITLEVGYALGDADTGRFVLKAWFAGDSKPALVLDVADYTYSPHADEPGGVGPVPLTNWNPQKLYSSDNVLHHLRDQGGAAQIYWDDFAFSDSWPPSWP